MFISYQQHKLGHYPDCQAIVLNKKFQPSFVEKGMFMPSRTWNTNPMLVEVEIDIIKDFIVEVGRRAAENKYGAENFLNAHHRAMLEVLETREIHLNQLKENRTEIECEKKAICLLTELHG